MRNLTEGNITDAVLDKIFTEDKRRKKIYTAFINHLHGFIRDVNPTPEEWFQAIQFLTNIGHKCDDVRQEYILFSDTIGASILVDAINNRKPEGATVSSVLGPFYREGAESFEHMESIAGETKGEVTIIQGCVLDTHGNPIENALLDIWQTAPNGLYEQQDPDQKEMNLRGKIRTDSEGRYIFKTVMPVAYGIPDDGPVGQMLHKLGRHNMRPAHIHFIISADGFETVITQIFVEGDPYLESDAVFGVKNSLVTDFVYIDNNEEIDKYEMKQPFYLVNYDFSLSKDK